MEHFFSQRILSAVTLEDPEYAIPLANAFISGGLNIMEVTFRTEATVESIKAIRAEFPDFIIGAGTILNANHVEMALEAGAHFGLAPGFNPKVVDAAKAGNLPFIPGVMTPSEVDLALERQCHILKLFPVKLLGGVSMIKSLNGPYKHTGVKFIPMGGINLVNMKDYLAISNVLAIGGSWICKRSMIENKQYDEITRQVKKAVDKTKR